MHKEALGKSGGLLVAWNNDILDVSEVHIDLHSISIKCFSFNCSFTWMFSGVYGPVNHADRMFLWEELSKV